MVILIYIIFVAIPVALWLWFFRHDDRFEPEPLALIVKLVLISGAFAVGVSIFFEFIVDHILLSEYDISGFIEGDESVSVPIIIILFSTIVAVVIEEVVKYFILTKKVYFAKSFNQIKDGVIYGVSLGLGFAFYENTIYFLSFFGDDATSMVDITALSLTRTIGPLMMHFVTTGIVGLYIGKKKFTSEHKKSLIIKGLIVAICIHLIYNTFVIFFDSFLPAIIVVLIAFGYLMKELKKDEIKMVWKLVRKG